MTLFELYRTCENLDHNTVFNIFDVTKCVGHYGYNDIPTKYWGRKIIGFKLLSDVSVNVYF